ncbi:hypothetical protein FRE64_12790 [Euhalothece natronophila Z-M001]|uniref:Transposase n=1 Tax=Euhalothece natronophila Z-M001 TaxID=522448 RepID=A0A5B8NR99_9CHRO|nr:hypothetical protein [Euhalothece natronophila]QDZ38748.1 hypothetical protein FRE64_01595 [Euhalothece natronophila Z-M001]QDZ39010.1 hypothetical protein FRE64_03080 [Euhalothece natronophila Z-M001]QDZ39135.1 hypothetical protein FRE64_03800 [Euhalothece natronophila Z-M001]QDZ39651.1 hypothetical protein FRE64_06725 [Euhalothece natronophila Z-M001]QDZ40211.1 hypothetical protein FRE64_09775 [Euhalothece natronophila Z-M001]
MQELNEQFKRTLKDAARKLTGEKKRVFVAQVCLDYFQGSARRTERQMGWGRVCVQRGLDHLERGISYQDKYQERGRKKSEENLPNLGKEIRDLVEEQSQADPKFQTTFQYSRMSAQAVRNALIREKGYSDEQLPTRQTIGAMLNRLGYRLKKP